MYFGFLDKKLGIYQTSDNTSFNLSNPKKQFCLSYWMSWKILYKVYLFISTKYLWLIKSKVEMFWWLHVLVFLIFCGIKSRSKILITNIQIIIIVLFRRSKRDYFNMNTQLNLKLNSISRQKHSLISNNLFLTSTCCV